MTTNCSSYQHLHSPVSSADSEEEYIPDTSEENNSDSNCSAEVSFPSQSKTIAVLPHASFESQSQHLPESSAYFEEKEAVQASSCRKDNETSPFKNKDLYDPPASKKEDGSRRFNKMQYCFFCGL